MSDLAATSCNNCGCGCGCDNGFGGNSCIWIIILLFFCGGFGSNGCGNSCGNGCGNGFGNDSCSCIIWIILILCLCGGNGNGFGCC